MSGRILVVDDILANRKLLRARLEAKYCTVFEAYDGYSAIEVAEQTLPDVVLLDVMMPGIDGFETCRLMKENPKLSHIPIVMVTALNETRDRVKGLEAGADDFLTKPVSDFALSARLTSLMRFQTVAAELRKRQASARVVEQNMGYEAEALIKPGRILIIDEDESASARLERMLKIGNHEVSRITTMGSVMSDLGSSIDALIVPINTKLFDPIRLCSFLQMQETLRPLVIILTADPSEHERTAKALEVGASDILFTPVEGQEALARVRTQIKRARYIELLRKRLDRGLEMAVVDQLTGLYNRRYMDQELKRHTTRATRGGQAVSVVAADIDHFKAVNDTFGHDIGDAVLKEFSRRLMANVRPNDIVCRPGGEEFCVILPDTDAKTAHIAAERFREAVAGAPFDGPNGQQFKLTVSLGVATLTGPNDNDTALLKRADEALYRAKQAGRNRVVTQQQAA